MRKCSKRQTGILLVCLFSWLVPGRFLALAADTAGTPYSALSNTLLQRAQNEVTRIEALVENGTLPKSQLDQARARLADAQDEAILSETLYGPTRLQDLSERASDGYA